MLKNQMPKNTVSATVIYQRTGVLETTLIVLKGPSLSKNDF